MAPKVEVAHKEARKEQILKAALLCFAEKGLHKTTMQDICLKAELSPGAVYSYFKGKDELIFAMNEFGKAQNQSTFKMALKPGAGFTEILFGTLKAFINQYKDPFFKLCAKTDYCFFAEGVVNDDFKVLITDNYLLTEKKIIELIEMGKQTGEVNREVDTAAMAQIFFGMVQSVSAQLNFNPDFDIDKYIEACIDLVKGKFFVGEGNK